jgi:hypothetical protein
MSTLTDAFDAAVQIREDAIDRIFRAMHTAGVVQHQYVRAFNGKRIELSMAAPDITLNAVLQPDQRSRVTATARILYHSRDLANPADPGTTAVAQVVLRAVLALSGGDPAPLNANTSLIVGWAETTKNDITVYNAPVAVQNEVKDAVFDLVQSIGGGSYPLPATANVSSIAFRFLTSGSTRAAVIGLNLGGVKGAKTGLQQVFAQQDWGIALAKEYVLGSIRGRMSQQFGALPPPIGASSVVVSQATVCLIPGLFGGCIDSAVQRTMLDSFDVGLTAGKIVFSGAVRQTADAWYVPDVSATFAAEATLSLSANQSISVSVSQPQVQVQQWYAQVFNFLSGDALRNVVRDGVAQALAAGAQQAGLTSLFSEATLRELAALGTAGLVPITPTANQVEVRADGIVIHGTLNVGSITRSPVAEFTRLRGSGGALDRIFNAGASWAPGNGIERADWSFGDGQLLNTSGTGVQIVARHQYAATGVYDACLTVEDAYGRTATVCQTLRAGLLLLEHLPDTNRGPWRLCDSQGPFTVRLRVSDENGAPLEGATVTGGGHAFLTGVDGQVVFPLLRSDFGPTVDRVAFATGAVALTASHAGYGPDTRSLLLIDCPAQDQLHAFQNWLRDFLDRLAVKEWPWQKSGHVGPPIDPLGPRVQAAFNDLTMTIDVITRIVLLAEKGSTLKPLEKLLGLEAGEDGEQMLIARLDGMREYIDTEYKAAVSRVERMTKGRQG